MYSKKGPIPPGSGPTINHIAQVAVELNLNRGKSSLTILKAENPSEWSNPGPDTARLLWIKIK